MLKHGKAILTEYMLNIKIRKIMNKGIALIIGVGEVDTTHYDG